MSEHEEAQRLALDRYLRDAPPAEVLDELEARRLRGEIGLVRQAAPGTYTFVVRGKRWTAGGTP